MHKVLIQVEKIRSCVRQLNDLMVEYYEKTEAKEGVPPTDMDWEQATDLESQDKFILITARDALTGIIVGYVTYYVGTSPAYKTVVYATCGTLAVKVDQRGKGIATQLMAAAEPLLKMYHVKYISHGFRTVYKTEPLFPKLGYRLAELQFIKEL
jgi:GNAT superfamily N-acetyltransferase